MAKTIADCPAPTRPRRGWLVSLLLRRGRLWVGRFLQAYRRLANQSRRVRRSWSHRLGGMLTGAALLLALARASANTILVADGQVGISDNGQCSLIEAIENANDVGDGVAHDDCAAGNPTGDDIIALPDDGSFLLEQSLTTYYDSPTGLPLINSAIVIEGNGATIGRHAEDEAQFRLLAVSNSGDLTLNELTLRDGYALGEYGGGAVISAGQMTLNDSELSGNTAAQHGGAIYSVGTLLLNDSGFGSNSAGTNGGALHNGSGEVTITTTEFLDNMAGRAGGGIYNTNEGRVTIAAGIFAGNTAEFGGGLSTFGGTVSFDSSVLSGNQATYGGGGVHAIVIGPPPVPLPEIDTVTIANSTLDGNTANTYGGGIYVFSTSASIISSTISRNIANDNGGGADFHTANSNITIEDSTFVGNQSADNGGGISSVGANMVVTNSTVHGNTAAFGGGLYVGAAETIIAGTTVSGNSALLAGGGIRTLAGSDLLVSNSTISGNVVTSSVTFAGGFNHHTSDLRLINSTVTGNSAAQFGGGVRNYNGTATLQRNLIAGNVAETGREVDNLNGTLNANAHNLFGYAGEAGVNGLVPGPADMVPVEPLAAILSATLAENDGTTQTHALVANSPAVDAAPSAACGMPPVNGVDQRGRPRNANGDGLPSVNECDVGAFELQPSGPTPTATASPTVSPTPTATPPPTPIPGGNYYLPIVLDE